MRTLLQERDFPVASIRFFATARSAGTTLRPPSAHRVGLSCRERAALELAEDL